MGYIAHWWSDKLVHPSGGSEHPSNDTALVVHSDGRRRDGGECRLQVRFVAVPDCGHFGYIEHVLSKKIVHPYKGSINPSNNTSLVWHIHRHAACLFAFDLKNKYIIHSSGKIWHPYGGSSNPGNDTQLVLHSDRHSGAYFYFANTEMKMASPYPPPNLSHEWKLLRSSLDPHERYQISISYKMGMSRSKTANRDLPDTWTISGEDAKELFSSSEVYSSASQLASGDAWKEETDVKTDISVHQGNSVVVWQCIFVLEQYGDEYKFGSSILEYTDSPTKKPQL